MDTKRTLSTKELENISKMLPTTIKEEAIDFTLDSILPYVIKRISFKTPSNIVGVFGNILGTAVGIPEYDSNIATKLITTAGTSLGPVGAIVTSVFAPIVVDAIMDSTNTRTYEDIRDTYEEVYEDYFDGKRAGTLSVQMLDLAKFAENKNINNDRFCFDPEAQALLEYIQAVLNGVSKENACKIVNSHLNSLYTPADLNKALLDDSIQHSLNRYSSAIKALVEYEQNKSFLDIIEGMVGMDNGAVTAVIKAIDYANLGKYIPINLKEFFNNK